MCFSVIIYCGYAMLDIELKMLCKLWEDAGVVSLLVSAGSSAVVSVLFLESPSLLDMKYLIYDIDTVHFKSEDAS